MTLIIARIYDKKICIDTDSKITGEEVVRHDPVQGRLKALILDPKLCLCYAGNISYADEAYHYFLKQSTLGLDWNDYLQYLLQINLKSDNGTDFILAGFNGNIPLLFEIKDGAISSTQQSWLGDKSSFSAFQRLYQDEIDKKVEPIEAQSNSFRATLSSEISESVGGFHFSVMSNTKDYTDSSTGEISTVFEYRSRAELYNDQPVKIKFVEKDKWVSVPSGNAATGSFALSLCTSLPLQKPSLGVHFGHGNFGILFPPDNLVSTEVYSNVSASEFLDTIYEKHSLKLQGFEIQPETMGIKLIHGGPK